MRADDLELARRLRVEQQRVGRGAQLLDHGRHIRANGVVQHIALAAPDFEDRGNNQGQ